MARYARVALAFTPAAPIDDTALWAERETQVFQCVEALFQKGLHIAVYGERGVGKTSLANVLPKLIEQTRLQSLDAVRVDCNTNDTFSSIWRSVFRELRMPDAAEEGRGVSDPEAIRFRLGALERRTLIVLDELDRVADDDALSLLADTVKTLSDHAVEATLMLVGVASSVEALLGEHESVVRCLAQVPMPRMSETELAAILSKGFGLADLTVEEAASQRIVRLAEGLPHFAHLLGLHAGEHAVMDDRPRVDEDDVRRAEEKAVRSHSILSEYQQATHSPQPDHLFGQVLLACAFAPKNELGYFRAGDVREALSDVMGRPMQIPSFARHLNEFSSDKRGNVLVKHGDKRRYTYRFRNPLLQPFVKMASRTKGLINDELYQRLQARQLSRQGTPGFS